MRNNNIDKQKIAFGTLTQAKLGPLQVIVEGNTKEHFEDAFKRFKAVVQRERIIGDVKARMAYEKPSVKKRRKQREALERRLITEMRERMIASGEWEKRQKRREQKRIQRYRKFQQRNQEVNDE